MTSFTPSLAQPQAIAPLLPSATRNVLPETISGVQKRSRSTSADASSAPAPKRQSLLTEHDPVLVLSSQPQKEPGLSSKSNTDVANNKQKRFRTIGVSVVCSYTRHKHTRRVFYEDDLEEKLIEGVYGRTGEAEKAL